MHSGLTTSISKDVPWADLEVVHVAGPLRKRRIWQVSGLSPCVEFGVHDNSLVNLLRGVRERVFAVEENGELVMPPRPDPGIYREELAPFAQLLMKRVRVTTPWTYDQFVSTYVGRRRTIYDAAVLSLAMRPVDIRDAYSSAFLKAEKIPFYLKPDPAPRLIHPRTPRYNAAVGIFIKKIEHEVYHNVNKVWAGVSPTILKGYNASQVGAHMAAKWHRFKDPVAIGLDASRFDQHVSLEALEWEHACYRAYFQGDDAKTLDRLLSMQLETKVFARCPEGTVKYKVTGMRFSGDMNTGLGNCLLMSGMVWCWAHKQGVDCELANNGDDCVVFMERTDLAKWHNAGMKIWFRSLGFTMKVEEPVYVLEKVEFCQSFPLQIGGSWLMVRKHRHALAKDCISIKPLDNPGVFDKWRHAIGEAGLSLTGGVPVQQSFYAAMKRGVKGKALKNDLTLDTGFMRFAQGMDRKTTHITAESRVSYWLAFNVTPDEQEALEAYYDAQTPVWSEPIANGYITVPTIWT